MATQPRIEPLDSDEHDERWKVLLPGVLERPVQNILATLARHPALFEKWMPFALQLQFEGTLPARDRELLDLRTGWRCGSEYLWGRHVRHARRAGITDDELRRLQLDVDDGGWGAFDAALVRAADELHDTGVIGDDTWAVLATRYDDTQLIEVPMVVGVYHTVAFTVRSLGVQREPGVPGFEL